jgi:hypothetical protein
MGRNVSAAQDTVWAQKQPAVGGRGRHAMAPISRSDWKIWKMREPLQQSLIRQRFAFLFK